VFTQADVELATDNFIGTLQHAAKEATPDRNPQLKEGVNVETGVAMPFSTPRKRRPRVCTKSILDNFDEAVLRRIDHNFYPTEKQRPTLKTIHSKMCESTDYGGGVSSLRLMLRKMGFR
jgi:hypothetical protein